MKGASTGREPERFLHSESILLTFSHEIRTPVGAISNAAEALLRDESLSADNLALALVVQRQAHAISHLIEEVLGFGRLGSGRELIEQKTLLLCTPIQDAIDTCRSMIDSKGHLLEWRKVDKGVWVKGDRGRLSQVFTNILVNAIKFMDPGGKIELTVGQEGKDAVVTISDGGKGIDPEDLPHVFESFWQSQQAPQSTEKGLGIGLSLAKAIVELHGGNISAQSDGPGKGSQFRVTLPALKLLDSQT